MELTPILIVGIICWTIVRLVDSKKVKNKNKQTAMDSNGEMRAKMEHMQARIETLEKIVTDEKFDLHRQFDELSKGSDRAA
jgi:hypothetical protein